MKPVNKAIPRAVLLMIGIVEMLPIAANWQSMFGSVQKSVQNTIIVESAEDEKARLEQEMADLKAKIEKLSSLIEELSQGE